MEERPTSEPRICVVASGFGEIALAWSAQRSRPRVMRIFLSRPGIAAGTKVRLSYPGTPLASCREIDGLVRRIQAFLHGEDVGFDLDLVRMDLCSAFQQRVLRAEHAIPRGRVSTYGRLARHLGHTEGARAVGSGLANNPFPIVIPCHRAIRWDGTPGGFQGGTEMKRALLEMEGVTFDRYGRAMVSAFFY